MEKETLKKAIKLNDRIEKLFRMKRDLRPQHCSGVAFAKIPNGNGQVGEKNYQYHLWGTTPDCNSDNAIIMRHAIQAMYDKVSSLLEEAENELKELK